MTKYEVTYITGHKGPSLISTFSNDGELLPCTSPYGPNMPKLYHHPTILPLPSPPHPPPSPSLLPLTLPPHPPPPSSPLTLTLPPPPPSSPSPHPPSSPSLLPLTLPPPLPLPLPPHPPSSPSMSGHLAATGSGDNSIKLLDVDKMMSKSAVGHQEDNPVIRTIYDNQDVSQECVGRGGGGGKRGSMGREREGACD